MTIFSSLLAAMGGGVEAEKTYGVDACPAGWQLVPVEPTDEMRRAGVDAYNAHTSAMFFYVWKAMLAAAAQPPGVEGRMK